jgi:2'-5' RNA ligase
LDEPPALTSALSEAFVSDRATLYRSTLSPRGAVYDPLASFDLSRGGRLR